MFIVKEIVHQSACFCHAFKNRFSKNKASSYGILKPNVLQFHAFSLVEMLMALLVASLLLAALAPVMTKRMNESININGNMNPPDANSKKLEIDFNSNSPQNHFNCNEIKTDSDGSEYCEGEFTVPSDYNGIIKVTVVGAGGGGGAAPTAGYTEYTTVSNSHQFTVPAMVNKAEVTLVSGGAGGGAGGQITKTQTFVTSGDGGITNKTANDTITVNTSGTGIWTIPEAARGKNIIASACGGGGGGGASSCSYILEVAGSVNSGYGGGSGGYVLNKILNFGSANTQFTYYVGGGGGGAGGSWCAPSHPGYNGLAYGGGGGGYGGQGATGGGSGGPAETISNKVSGTPGTLLTSQTYGGAAGIGTTAPSEKGTHYTSGGAGGSPGGGGGGQLDWGGCTTGAGGGGGGASQIVIGSGMYLNAPGGGGGNGYILRTAWANCIVNTGAGGGGGGGAGGGAGGGINSSNGKGGAGGANGNGRNPGNPSTIFGSNYCAGGTGGLEGTDSRGATGKSGAIRLTYLDYGTGASGGGSGQVVPIQPVNVVPNENLTVVVGSGETGGSGGNISSSGTITNAAKGRGPTEAMISKLLRDATVLLITAPRGYAANGAYGGSPTGKVSTGVSGDTDIHSAQHGRVCTGNPAAIVDARVNGFATTNGNAAGNIVQTGDIKYAAKTLGGDGATTTLFGLNNHCTPGKGGTSTSINGTDATGYGGCGGGGGYSFGNGGKGAGGYARISWNKYWDTALNSGKGGYKLADMGAGGGGASGNILTYTVSVIGGQVIKIRIGKGGKGAYISNNTIVNAKKGGDTIFGDSAFGEIKAGGGYGGSSVSVNSSNNAFTNGTGGSISNICHYKSTNLLNKSSCIKGIKGQNADSAIGGKGASLAAYNNAKGEGGAGGIQDTGDGSNGKNASGYGSGGGGAAIRDLGKVDSSSQSNITNNKTIGGDGSNGRIILEWWE